jgi:hypothetical protein
MEIIQNGKVGIFLIRDPNRGHNYDIIDFTDSEFLHQIGIIQRPVVKSLLNVISVIKSVKS